MGKARREPDAERLARRVRVGGPGKRTGGNTGTAPWADLTLAAAANQAAHAGPLVIARTWSVRRPCNAVSCKRLVAGLLEVLLESIRRSWDPRASLVVCQAGEHQQIHDCRPHLGANDFGGQTGLGRHERARARDGGQLFSRALSQLPLAEIAGRLSERQLAEGSREELTAIARASSLVATQPSLSAEVIRAQVRSAVVDLLMLTGLTYDEARARVPASADALEEDFEEAGD